MRYMRTSECKELNEQYYGDFTADFASYYISPQACLFVCGARMVNVCMWNRRMFVVRMCAWHLRALAYVCKT